MSETTYISEELIMEGNMDSAGSSVVVAGRFKGELMAQDVLLEYNSIFDGNLIADKVTLGGLVKGEVAANTLNVASSAKVEGNLKTNALSIDLDLSFMDKADFLANFLTFLLKYILVIAACYLLQHVTSRKHVTYRNASCWYISIIEIYDLFQYNRFGI